jgi:hypothetical protein
MGQLWHGASRMMTMQENVLWVPIKHFTIDFVASKIERKKRGIIEEEKREQKRDKVLQRTFHSGLCEISYCWHY